MLLHTVVPLIKRLLFHKGGAHEARALWAKQAAAVEAPKGWRGEDSAKRSAAPEYRASEAQAGTKTSKRPEGGCLRAASRIFA